MNTETKSEVLTQDGFSKGDTLILEGQAGVGKTMMLVQMALFAGAGKHHFGMKFTKPLNVLFLHEDKDLIEHDNFSEYVIEEIKKTFEWNDEECEIAKNNVLFDRADNIFDYSDIGSYISKKFEARRFDIVILDTLEYFVQGDLSQGKYTADILYNQLNKTMCPGEGKPARFGVIVSRRIGKTNENEKSRYNAGLCVLESWARCVMKLSDCVGFCSELELTKNSGIVHFEDEKGNSTNRMFFRKRRR